MLPKLKEISEYCRLPAKGIHLCCCRFSADINVPVSGSVESVVVLTLDGL